MCSLVDGIKYAHVECVWMYDMSYVSNWYMYITCHWYYQYACMKHFFAGFYKNVSKGSEFSGSFGDLFLLYS